MPATTMSGAVPPTRPPHCFRPERSTPPSSSQHPFPDPEDAKRADHEPDDKDGKEYRKASGETEDFGSGVEAVEDRPADEDADDARTRGGDVREAHVEPALVGRDHVLDEGPVDREEDAEAEPDHDAALRRLGGELGHVEARRQRP